MNRSLAVGAGLLVAGLALGYVLISERSESGPGRDHPTPVISTVLQPTTVRETATLGVTATLEVTTTQTVTVIETSVETQTVTVEVPVSTTVTVTETAETPAGVSASDWPNDGARWSWREGLEAEHGLWAGTLLDGSEVHVDPLTPQHLLPYVRVHEHSHVLQAQYYGRVDAAPEYEALADCMSVLQGWRGDLRYGCPEHLMPLAEEILG